MRSIRIPASENGQREARNANHEKWQALIANPYSWGVPIVVFPILVILTTLIDAILGLWIYRLSLTLLGDAFFVMYWVLVILAFRDSIHQGILCFAIDKTAKVWSLRPQQLDLLFTEHTAPLTSAAIRPSGQHAATVGQSVKIWQTEIKFNPQAKVPKPQQ